MMRRSSPLPPAPKLFDDATVGPPPAGVHLAHIDGGSRGNPGPAAYAVILRDGSGKIVIELAKQIGRETNNVAEYFALIAALDYATTHGIPALRIRSDSELLVKQMQGRYKVRSPELRPLHERAVKIARQLQYFRIEHIYRELNAEADALANFALDQPGGTPIERRGPGSILPPKIAPASVSPSSKAIPPATPAAAPLPDPPARPVTIHGIRAKFVRGVLVPADTLDLPDGISVLLNLRTTPEK
ncbi:MAG: ribonuclease HI family protein [Candidatus Acidiferrales bacterium]